MALSRLVEYNILTDSYEPRHDVLSDIAALRLLPFPFGEKPPQRDSRVQSAVDLENEEFAALERVREVRRKMGFWVGNVEAEIERRTGVKHEEHGAERSDEPDNLSVRQRLQAETNIWLRKKEPEIRIDVCYGTSAWPRA